MRHSVSSVNRWREAETTHATGYWKNGPRQNQTLSYWDVAPRDKMISSMQTEQQYDGERFGASSVFLLQDRFSPTMS